MFDSGTEERAASLGMTGPRVIFWAALCEARLASATARQLRLT